MSEIYIPELHVDDVLNRIVEEVKRNQMNKLQTSQMTQEEKGQAVVDWHWFATNLDVARHHAEVGNAIPAWTRFGRMRRWIAQKVARTVLYFSNFITNQQKLFNGATLETLKMLGNGIQNLERKLKEGPAWGETDFRQLTEAVTQLQAQLTGLSQERQTEEVRVTESMVRLQEQFSGLSRERQAETQRLWEALARGEADFRQLTEVVTQLQVQLTNLSQGRQAEEVRMTESMVRLQEQFSGLSRERQAETQRLWETLARREAQAEGMEKNFVRIKRDLRFQERRVTLLLEEARKRFPEPLNQQQIEIIADEARHQLDAFYVSLEDEFRGSKEDIKERLQVYLPILREAGVGTNQTPLLDIGCGRGEWLDVLKEEGCVAQGIDINPMLVRQCQEEGLNVSEEELLTYLQRLPNNCLGAVTGFHVIEHLPFDRVVSLCDETIRVLKPGGIAIFETPNPQNILVGSCTFYTDPTHRNPLPPSMMQFLVEARGFSRVRILRLNPLLQHLAVQEDSEVAKQFNEYFYGPLDYAVIGWKV